MSSNTSPVLPHALKLPIFKQLKDKRVVLASSSPRRKELLDISGLRPEIVPSTFEENLPKSTYEHALAEYPIATAGEKAIEVYERLVRSDDRNPPDLVISADTVILYPPQQSAHPDDPRKPLDDSEPSRILEKPFDTDEQLRMLQDMSGKACEVVTGVTIAFPILGAPGYRVQSMFASTIVHFYENTDDILKAYVDHGEGHDRAGGFAIQGAGGILVKSIEGDYNNVVGFPTAAFWKWMGELLEEGTFDQ